MKFRISLTLLALATLSFAPRLHSQSSQGASQEQLHERSSFHLVEATISEIEQAYRSHLLTPEQLVKMRSIGLLDLADGCLNKVEG